MSYRDNYSAVFGHEAPTHGGGRSVFVYVDGQPFQVDEGWEPTERHVPVVSDLYMDGTASTDGTDIGSRRKRREYMKAMNLADAADFNGVWTEAEKKREAFRRGEHDDRELRETVGRVHYEMSKRR